jgi:hypothetical protein
MERKYTKQDVIELLEEIRYEQKKIYDDNTFEDYGQLINDSGEEELLDAIEVISNKIDELNELDIDDIDLWYIKVEEIE